MVDVLRFQFLAPVSCFHDSSQVIPESKDQNSTAISYHYLIDKLFLLFSWGILKCFWGNVLGTCRSKKEACSCFSVLLSLDCVGRQWSKLLFKVRIRHLHSNLGSVVGDG